MKKGKYYYQAKKIELLQEMNKVLSGMRNDISDMRNCMKTIPEKIGEVIAKSFKEGSKEIAKAIKKKERGA